MMIIKSLTTISLVLFSSLVFSADTDFDNVCRYFEKLQIEVSNRHLSNIERGDFISGLVNKELSQDSNARIAWTAIINATADQRYGLFKSAVKSATQKKWQCNAMEMLITSTDAEYM